LQGVLGGLPEQGARQRLEQAAAEVQRGGLVEAEAQGRLAAVGRDPPGLAPELADGLLEGEADAAEQVEVPADRLLGDAQLGGHPADGPAAVPAGEGPQQDPLAAERCVVTHDEPCPEPPSDAFQRSYR
jgi:hypothetical protein